MCEDLFDSGNGDIFCNNTANGLWNGYRILTSKETYSRQFKILSKLDNSSDVNLLCASLKNIDDRLILNKRTFKIEKMVC